MEWLFILVSLLAIVAAGMMLTRQNAVHSALFLIVNFGCVAFLYLMLDAPFLAMVQVTVYTGAIMVLFLFVIMLLGAEATSDAPRRMRWMGFAGTAIAIVILIVFAFPLANNMLDEAAPPPELAPARLRVINAIPGSDEASFTVMEMGFAMPLAGTVRGNVLLDPADESIDALRIDDVVYEYGRDAAAYVDLPAGDYNFSAGLSDSSYASGPIASAALSLDADAAYSVLFYENAEQQLEVTVLEDQVAAPAVGKMRLKLINAVTDKQVALVDIGQYTTRRSLCEDDSCSSLIPHRVLIEQLPAGQHTSLELEEGSYNLAFVDAENTVLRTLAGYKAQRGLVETRVFVREPGPPGSLPSYRAAAFHAMATSAFGSPEALGQVLFIDYVLPVMLVGVLLLVALIGVIVLARPDALAQAERRRINRRRRVNRPLASVIAQQTGSDILRGDAPAQLPSGESGSH